jgi:hypothetical protein
MDRLPIKTYVYGYVHGILQKHSGFHGISQVLNTQKTAITMGYTSNKRLGTSGKARNMISRLLLTLYPDVGCLVSLVSLVILVTLVT